MTDKNDKLIKKMAEIIKRQQALINKLAQCLPGDPLCDTDGNILGQKPSKPAPKPPAPKPPAKPDVHKADTGLLPPEVKAALDVAAPHLKGALRLDVKGNTVDVRYNMNMVKDRASNVQKAVAGALADLGLTVVQCIGDTNTVANY